MCIRDSFETDLIDVTGGRVSNEIFLSPVFGPDGNVSEVFGICLLYTSDAADDLLCVDLGGRRIIQKKNKHKNKNRILIQV